MMPRQTSSQFVPVATRKSIERTPTAVIYKLRNSGEPAERKQTIPRARITPWKAQRASGAEHSWINYFSHRHERLGADCQLYIRDLGKIESWELWEIWESWDAA